MKHGDQKKKKKEKEKDTQEFFRSVYISVVIVRPIDFHLLFKEIEHTCLRYCFPRYLDMGSTGMSIMDIGILTGFKPEQKSLDKVTYLSLIM